MTEVVSLALRRSIVQFAKETGCTFKQAEQRIMKTIERMVIEDLLLNRPRPGQPKKHDRDFVVMMWVDLERAHGARRKVAENRAAKALGVKIDIVEDVYKRRKNPSKTTFNYLGLIDGQSETDAQLRERLRGWDLKAVRDALMERWAKLPRK